MKLKSIICSLSYGKSRKTPVRREGSRRVKQTEVMRNSRQSQKSLPFIDRYDSRGNTFNTDTFTVEQAALLSGMSVGKWLQESSNNVVGIQNLEVDFSETESKIQLWVNKGKSYE